MWERVEVTFRFQVLALIGLLMLSVQAWADGGFIPALVYQKVLIPDQRALIHFADGTETLVIDTALKADGTNFAWLMPAPSVPEIEPAGRGLFTTLSVIFQPRIPPVMPGYYWAFIIAGLAAAYIKWRLDSGKTPIGPLVASAVFLLLAIAFMRSSLRHTPAGMTVSQVSVLGRQRVGVYDTVTLRSPDGQAVFDWLQQNGFALRTNFTPAIQAYCREGWCFVASRVACDHATQQAAEVHPLLLKFRTDRPVYPLRLTGLDNEPCRIELYVFGPSRAEIPGFQVERATVPVYPQLDGHSWRFQLSPELRVCHPGLRSLVRGSPAATKLCATLSSSQMGQDAYVHWTPLREQQAVRYSPQGAASLAANIGVPFLVCGAAGLLLSRGNGGGTRGSRARIVCLGLMAGGLAAGGGLYACLPKTEIVPDCQTGFSSTGIHLDIGNELARRAELRARKAIHPLEEEAQWVRQQVAEILQRDYQGPSGSPCLNSFTGDLLREEDSPGNYTIRQTPAEVDYIWYDAQGSPSGVLLFQIPP